MQAATIVDGAVVVAEHPDPAPGSGELLVRVRAAGLNNADLLQVRGFYPAPPGSPADIPGLEVAGEVAATGAGVTRFSAGDRVMAIVGGGGQAELCVVHERVAMPVPDGVPWEAAGAIPETYTTAHDALFTQARLRTGQRVCIHGGAGGVGTAAIHLATATGARVWATVRNAELRSAVAQLGCAVLAPEDFPADHDFDVVLELIGAPNMAANLEALATGGRICIIGVGAGGTAEINLLGLMAKRATIMGSTLRARPLEDKARAARLVESEVLPLFGDGVTRPLIAATYPLSDVAAAYERFAAGGKLGKIVLTL